MEIPDTPFLATLGKNQLGGSWPEGQLSSSELSLIHQEAMIARRKEEELKEQESRRLDDIMNLCSNVSRPTSSIFHPLPPFNTPPTPVGGTEGNENDKKYTPKKSSYSSSESKCCVNNTDQLRVAISTGSNFILVTCGILFFHIYLYVDR